MERLTRGLFAACGVVLGLSAAPSARADVQPILVGNDAMLSGGAVLASVKDAGAAWYNPAGLAFVRHSSVELSAKAFLLRMYDVEALSSVQLPDGRWNEPVGHREIVAVPTALIFARRLNERLTAALSLFLRGSEFVRTSDDLWGGRTYEKAGQADDLRYHYRESFSVIQRSSTYHAGLSLGTDLLPNLRIGLSAFGIFETSDVSAELSTEYAEAGPGMNLLDAPRNVLGNSTRSSLTTFGAEILGGVQWSPGRGWDLGLTFRTPSWILGAWEDAQASFLNSRTLAGGAVNVESKTARAFAEMVQHVRISIGVARHLRRGWVALEGSLSPPLQNPSWGIDRDLVWNLRLGGRFDLSERFSIGGGLFTDRRGGRAPRSFAEWHPDFYGGVLGAEYRKEILLGGESKSAPPDAAKSGSAPAPARKARALTMATVLALRYSLGYGPFGTPDIDPRGNTLHNLPVIPTRGFQHEIGIHLGSGVHY